MFKFGDVVLRNIEQLFMLTSIHSDSTIFATCVWKFQLKHSVANQMKEGIWTSMIGKRDHFC